MTFRPFLSSVLRGEEAAPAHPEAHERLEAFAARCRRGRAGVVRDECAARQRQPHCTTGVDYLLAVSARSTGGRARAAALLALGSGWSASAVGGAGPGGRAEPHAGETQAGARLLVRAHEGWRGTPRASTPRACVPHRSRRSHLGCCCPAPGRGRPGRHGRSCWSGCCPRSRPGRFGGLEERPLEFVEHGPPKAGAADPDAAGGRERARSRSATSSPGSPFPRWRAPAARECATRCGPMRWRPSPGGRAGGGGSARRWSKRCGSGPARAP